MAMGSTFEDRSDLFPPPYIPGDPESARAAAEWQARNRNMTYDLVDELRMPRFGDTRTIAEMNVNPFAVSNANDGDPRGDVDPLALVALAQGGPYDIDARRAAIQARRDAIAKLLTDQQVAQQLAQAAPTDTASRELTSGLRPDYKDTGQGIQAGDMAVSGATPGSVTQQGFFANAVPNEPDPNNVFSAPPPPNSTPYTHPDESEPDTGKGKSGSKGGFDEDAANQAVADALAEAIANAPTEPADPADPGSQHSSGKAADVVSPSNAPADAPSAPSSHNSGRSADVVSPSTTNAPASFNSGYSDFIGGPAGFAGFNAGSMMPGFGIPGDAGIPASGNVLGGPTAPAAAAPGLPGGNTFGAPVGQTLAEMGAPTSFGPIGPGSPAGRNATTGAPVATPADNPDTFVGPIDPDPATTQAMTQAATVSPFGRSKDDSSQTSMDKQAADKAALADAALGRNAVATALSEQGRGRAGIADFAPDISLSDMASLASMGLPAAPGVPASDFADFATGKSMDAAVAAASMNAPGESGPVGPGGLGGLGSLGGPSVGGFSATGGFGSGTGGPGQGPSEGAMAAQAAADTAAQAAADAAAATSEGAAPAGPSMGPSEGAAQAMADAAQAAADAAQDAAQDAQDAADGDVGDDAGDGDAGDVGLGDLGGLGLGDLGADGGDGDGGSDGDGGGGDY